MGTDGTYVIDSLITDYVIPIFLSGSKLPIVAIILYYFYKGRRSLALM